MFDFKEIIDSKQPCEIYLRNKSEFYVGLILCANEESVCIKSIGKMGKLECYKLLPTDAIEYICQFTEYTNSIGYIDTQDVYDADCTFADNLEFFGYASKKKLFIVIEDGDGRDIISGKIDKFGKGYLKLMSSDAGTQKASGVTFFNLDNYFIIKWGGKVQM